MTLTTSRLALPYPEPNDTVDVPRDVQALAAALDPITPSFSQGLYSARPAAGTAGRIYVATDTGGVYYDNGTAWRTLSAPVVSALPTVGMQTGDEVFLTVTAADGLWHCRYDSAIGDAYKWRVIGGPPIVGAASGAGRQLTNQTAYVALPTDPITITMPTEGIYDVEVQGNVWSSATGFEQAFLAYTVGATAASDNWSVQFGMNVGQASVASLYRHTFPGPTLTCAERGRVTGNFTATFSGRRLIARPVRLAP